MAAISDFPSYPVKVDVMIPSGVDATGPYGGSDHVVAIRWHDNGLWFWAYGEEYRLAEDGIATTLGGRTTRWMRYTPPMVAARPLNFDIQQIRSK